MKKILESEIKVILWDFDGVLLNSNSVRDYGFTEVLKEFPVDQVAELMTFHQKNGGLSRYVKFRFFFENIRKEPVSEREVQEYATKYSDIMRKHLNNKDLLIKETNENIRKFHHTIMMHIVSGSDQEELRYLCNKLGLKNFFKSIYGSPRAKIDLVKMLIESNQYNKSQCVLIGDSYNDYEAAKNNNIKFVAYNNPALEHLSDFIIKF
ncbi:MAG: HAD-IA family hydrolase [Methylomarinum sp.]|nr:HAD-IA family hydrolase [Methylomarinum sp.]